MSIRSALVSGGIEFAVCVGVHPIECSSFHLVDSWFHYSDTVVARLCSLMRGSTCSI